MNLILLIILAMVLAGGLFALSMGGTPRDRVDRDADGEPDEPGGPASGAP